MLLIILPRIGCGQGNVSPYILLNSRQSSLASSKCCSWSSPIGTWVALKGPSYKNYMFNVINSRHLILKTIILFVHLMDCNFNWCLVHLWNFFLGWTLLSLSITARLATSFVGVALKKYVIQKKKKKTIIADSLVQENISCHQNWVWIQPQTTFVFVNTSFSLKGQIYSEKKNRVGISCRID